jgi:GTP diphosphokinase / guanosine-3',5'-bis(diphosphate) 3'-diphosphatase
MSTNLNVLLSNLIALNATKFSGKLDKGDKPYILHCLRVMYGVSNEDLEVQCIAISHDLIEDTDVTYTQLIELGCTERVIAGIKTLTKVPGESHDEYLVKILANIDACKVKLSDLKDNSDINRLKGLRQKDFDRLIKYQQMYSIIKGQLDIHSKS